MKRHGPEDVTKNWILSWRFALVLLLFALTNQAQDGSSASSEQNQLVNFIVFKQATEYKCRLYDGGVCTATKNGIRITITAGGNGKTTVIEESEPDVNSICAFNSEFTEAYYLSDGSKVVDSDWSPCKSVGDGKNYIFQKEYSGFMVEKKVDGSIECKKEVGVGNCYLVKIDTNSNLLIIKNKQSDPSQARVIAQDQHDESNYVFAYEELYNFVVFKQGNEYNCKLYNKSTECTAEENSGTIAVSCNLHSRTIDSGIKSKCTFGHDFNNAYNLRTGREVEEWKGCENNENYVYQEELSEFAVLKLATLDVDKNYECKIYGGSSLVSCFVSGSSGNAITVLESTMANDDVKARVINTDAVKSRCAFDSALTNAYKLANGALTNNWARDCESDNKNYVYQEELGNVAVLKAKKQGNICGLESGTYTENCEVVAISKENLNSQNMRIIVKRANDPFGAAVFTVNLVTTQCGLFLNNNRFSFYKFTDDTIEKSNFDECKVPGNIVYAQEIYETVNAYSFDIGLTISSIDSRHRVVQSTDGNKIIARSSDNVTVFEKQQTGCLFDADSEIWYLNSLNFPTSTSDPNCDINGLAYIELEDNTGKDVDIAIDQSGKQSSRYNKDDVTTHDQKCKVSGFLVFDCEFDKKRVIKVTYNLNCFFYGNEKEIFSAYEKNSHNKLELNVDCGKVGSYGNLGSIRVYHHNYNPSLVSIGLDTNGLVYEHKSGISEKATVNDLKLFHDGNNSIVLIVKDEEESDAGKYTADTYLEMDLSNLGYPSIPKSELPYEVHSDRVQVQDGPSQKFFLHNTSESEVLNALQAEISKNKNGVYIITHRKASFDEKVTEIKCYYNKDLNRYLVNKDKLLIENTHADISHCAYDQFLLVKDTGSPDSIDHIKNITFKLNQSDIIVTKIYDLDIVKSSKVRSEVPIYLAVQENKVKLLAVVLSRYEHEGNRIEHIEYDLITRKATLIRHTLFQDLFRSPNVGNSDPNSIVYYAVGKALNENDGYRFYYHILDETLNCLLNIHPKLFWTTNRRTYLNPANHSKAELKPDCVNDDVIKFTTDLDSVLGDTLRKFKKHGTNKVKFDATKTSLELGKNGFGKHNDIHQVKYSFINFERTGKLTTVYHYAVFYNNQMQAALLLDIKVSYFGLFVAIFFGAAVVFAYSGVGLFNYCYRGPILILLAAIRIKQLLRYSKKDSPIEKASKELVDRSASSNLDLKPQLFEPIPVTSLVDYQNSVIQKKSASFIELFSKQPLVIATPPHPLKGLRIVIINGNVFAILKSGSDAQDFIKFVALLQPKFALFNADLDESVDSRLKTQSKMKGLHHLKFTCNPSKTSNILVISTACEKPLKAISEWIKCTSNSASNIFLMSETIVQSGSQQISAVQTIASSLIFNYNFLLETNFKIKPIPTFWAICSSLAIHPSEDLLKEWMELNEICIGNLPNEIEYFYFKGNENDLKHRYMQICLTKLGPATVCMLPHNKSKNRYGNIIPCDEHLIELRPAINGNNYINATRMGKYIAAQGPLSSTLHDFLFLIWYEKITVINMLTNLVEPRNGIMTVKCFKYFPDTPQTPVTTGVNADKIFLHITIHSSVSMKAPGSNKVDYVVRVLKFSAYKAVNGKSELVESRKVTQFHYIDWPDHGSPSIPKFLEYCKLVKSMAPVGYNDKGAPPQLVHCSAGVGRTGSYIAAQIMFEEGVNNKLINIDEIICEMRTRRTLMVQTVQQYMWLIEIGKFYFKIGQPSTNDEFLKMQRHRNSVSNHQLSTVTNQYRVRPSIRHSNALKTIPEEAQGTSSRQGGPAPAA